MRKATTGNRIANALQHVTMMSTVALLAMTNAATAEDSFEILPRWKKGETVRYEIVKSRIKTQPDRTPLNTTNRTDLEIQVLKAAKDGFALAWTLGETRIDDPAEAKNPLTKATVNLLKGHRIVLELDSQAAIEGIENWQEVQERTRKMLDLITRELKASGVDAKAIAGLRAQSESMFGSKEQVERYATQDAQLFFMPIGVEFDSSRVVALEDQLANPFGGEPLPSRVRFTLKEVDKKAGVAKVTWSQTVAPEDARRIMNKTVAEMAKRMGKPVPDADLLKSFTIEDAAEFIVDISSGWIQNLTHQRLTKTGGRTQTDVIRITRKRE